MIELGIKRPVTVLMLVLGIVLFAGITLPRIPVELYPSVQSGQISVITRLRGGIAASEVEKYVTRPLEEAFSEINGLREMISSSRESESNIVLYFHHGINTDFTVIDVREKLAMVRHLLPKEVEKPIIAKYEQSDAPILIISLSSDIKSPEELRQVCEEKIKERIMRVSGVANVEIGGGRERKFLIEIDNARLESFHLPILKVVERINLNNITISAGEIEQNDTSYTIRATGEYTSIAEIEKTGIAITPSGSIIRISDIARVRDSFYEPTSFARLNVKPVVSLYVQKETTANTITVASFVEKEVNALSLEYAKDMVITVVKNDAEFIRKAIASLREALATGSLLLTGILFLFLRNLRSIGIVITTLPLSIFLSVIMMYFSGLTFNVMTLSGLAMGLGNVMDNAIVILENISYHHHRKTFPDKRTMIIEGTRELSLPIVASTLTTMVVFLPLVFLEPEIRQMYVPFALTITFSLIASVICTLVFVPPQCYRWQDRYDLDFQRWYLIIRMRYSHLLRLSFRYQAVVWSVVLVLMLAAARIMMTRDAEFIDPGDANTFRIGIQFPPATRIESSNMTVKKMEESLMAYKGQVTRVVSKVEKLHTFIEVKVNKDADKFKEVFRKRFGEFQPAFVYYQDSAEAGSKEMFVDFYGNDYDILKQLAFASSGRLQQVKGLTDIKIRMREDEPEVNLRPDVDKLAIFGLTTLYLGNTLHCQLRGLIATQYRTEGKQIETIARLLPGSVPAVAALPFLGIVTPRGDSVSLGQLGEIAQVKSTQEIWHKNKKRFIQISANRLKMGLTTAANRINTVLKGISFPKDYSFKISGDYEKTVKNRSQFILAITLTVILIFLVLASLFESYLQPMLIMFALPLSIIGVALSLWVFKKPLSLGVWIGLMILFGSVVYGSIILVEKINTRRVGRTDLLRVIFESCRERLRPELITLLMRSLGLLPMVLSNDEAAAMWKSLGLTVLFGTITGTMLTLLVVPVAYYTIEEHALYSARIRTMLGILPGRSLAVLGLAGRLGGRLIGLPLRLTGQLWAWLNEKPTKPHAVSTGTTAAAVDPVLPAEPAQEQPAIPAHEIPCPPASENAPAPAGSTPGDTSPSPTSAGSPSTEENSPAQSRHANRPVVRPAAPRMKAQTAPAREQDAAGPQASHSFKTMVSDMFSRARSVYTALLSGLKGLFSSHDKDDEW